MSIRTLTSKEVMGTLNISEPTFYKWVKTRRLRGYKVGRKWLFKEDEIMALIESGVNIPDEKSDDTRLASRKAAVDRILSKSVKISDMTAADLVRAGRERVMLHEMFKMWIR